MLLCSSPIAAVSCPDVVVGRQAISVAAFFAPIRNLVHTASPVVSARTARRKPVRRLSPPTHDSRPSFIASTIRPAPFFVIQVPFGGGGNWPIASMERGSSSGPRLLGAYGALLCAASSEPLAAAKPKPSTALKVRGLNSVIRMVAIEEVSG